MPTERQIDLLKKLHGPTAAKYAGLQLASESHRRQHGADCSLRPVSPLKLPFFQFLNHFVVGTAFLEIGCGLGYSAALMVEAAGPQLRVDTIEPDPAHAALAREQLGRYGLSGQINIIEGDPREVLANLPGPYDIVFVDDRWEDYPLYLRYYKRLIASGGLLVSGGLAPYFEEGGQNSPFCSSLGRYLEGLIADAAFKTIILPDEWVALSVRVTL